MKRILSSLTFLLGIGAVFVAGLVVAGILGLRAWREHQLTEEKVAARKAFLARFGIDSDGRQEFIALPPLLPHAMGPAKLAVRAAGLLPGMRVLDCCAAPGGKSFAAAIAMENRGELISCDIHTHKLKLIQKTIILFIVSNF